MAESYDNKAVSIKITSATPKSYADDSKKIIQLVQESVLSSFTQAELGEARVKVLREDAKTYGPQGLIVQLLHKDTYTLDMMKVEVDENYGVKKIIENYEEPDDGAEPEKEYEAYDFYIGTPVPDYPTAKAAVNDVYSLVTGLGYTAKKMLGSEASVANYKAGFLAGAKGFFNVGHGNQSCIAVYDGTISSSWFQKQTSSALNPEVILLNSCLVSNDPFKAAIVGAGSRTFIGGVTTLRVGPS